MGITEILAILGTVLKFAGFLIDKYKKTPSEKRRDSLSELDKAIEEAHKKDLRDLSKWIGGRL
jgi:hypothetical protein